MTTKYLTLLLLARYSDHAWSFLFPAHPHLVAPISTATSFSNIRKNPNTSLLLQAAPDSTREDGEEEEEVDVVVIGAGIGGLSCAALTSKYGMKTLCVEAHDTPGGVAHSFTRYSTSISSNVPFTFDSGPSLITGLSSKGTNPLRQVLDAVGTADEIEWKKYDGWIIHDNADNTSFKLMAGDGPQFEDEIERKAGVSAKRDFQLFRDKMLERGGLSESSAYIPPLALRGDIFAVLTMAQYSLQFLSIGAKGLLFTGPFTNVMNLFNVRDKFIRAWFDYLAFALSGLSAAQTQAAPVLYMMMDLHKKGACLDYPIGGMDSLIQALVRGMSKHGGELRLNSRVERILLEESNNQAVCKGVVLDNGQIIRARKGVVCNAPLWNMARILNDSVHVSTGESSSPVVLDAVQSVQEEANAMNITGSFMHLHLGIPSDGLPDNIECHHSVLDMEADVTAEQNMVIISIPTVFDPSLAPEGYHIIHAYTAACEYNFDQWEKFLPGGVETGKVGLNPNSGVAASYKKTEGYKRLKEERAEVLWRAIEKVIPDVRERAKLGGSIVLSASPLTHRRYNQRYKGTYGPAPPAGKDIWELKGATTKIKNLLACGDTSFPGIGLPGVAASGTIAANTLASVTQQLKLIKEMKEKGALQ